MGSEQARDLRQQGIAAAKAGDKDTARQLLQQSIRLEPDNEAAWLWLASVARNPQEKLFCLQKLLEINPQNETALKAMQALGGAQPNQPAAPPPIRSIKPLSTGTGSGASAPPKISTQEMMAQPPGIPVAHPQRVADAQRQAEMTLREYLAPVNLEGVKWTPKTSGRAGERDHLVLRAQVTAGVLAFLVVLGALATLFVLNNADARALIFAPTWTPTFTPTMTSTPTPGVTPTPSPTPAVTFTPSPTFPAEITPFDLYFPPPPTDIYPRPDSQPLREAVALIDAGRAAQALPTMAVERESVSQLFNPRPYYYEAIALVEADQGERALRVLEEAEGRLNTQNSADFKPVIDAGYAYVYARLAERAFAEGSGAQGREFATLTEERAEPAIAGDPRNATAHLALARVYRLNSEFGEALRVLDRALAVPELRTNINLIVERARVYFEQGEDDLALQDVALALYINQATEAAHLLQIEIALRRDDPGLAVIYTEAYLFYYPGSVRGWKLLGDARLLEDKPDLALAAYSQALTGGEESDTVVEVRLARAALYEVQGRWDLARDDYTEAFRISSDPDIQAQRMVAAYRAGNLSTALQDAEDLAGIVPDNELALLRARILIDGAGEGDDEVYQEASSLLNNLSGLSPEDIATANEYLARAQFALESYSNALRAVEAALEVGETGYRRYLRGLILQAQGQRDDAARDFEWVLTWSEIYPLPFRADAEARLEELRGA